MKRLLILVCVALLLGLVYFFTAKNIEEPVLVADKFRIKDTKTIHRIEIEFDKFENMTFERSSDHWRLQRNHKARANAMQNLLEVFEQLQIKYIPQEAARKNIERDMDNIGIDAKAYDEQGTLLKHYVIGSSTVDERGTIVKLAGENQAYVTHLPTLEGSIRGRFVMRYDEWRDRVVFGEGIEDIQNVEVKYPRQQGESFRIEGDNVISLSTNQRVRSKVKVEHYIDGFSSVIAEAYENSNPHQDSIRQLLPFCLISIELKNGEQRNLNLYPVENYVDQSLVTLSDTPRINRYFGDTSYGDFLLLQQRLVGKLLRGFSYFAEE
jgi:hypothetical protein